MSQLELLKDLFESGKKDDLLMSIYLDEQKLDYQRNRYVQTLNKYKEIFEGNDVEIYSAPGRSEVGGNHTDHQNGEVLAASINLDAIAVAAPLADAVVKVVSDNYPMVTIDLTDLEMKNDEKETTTALIKGVLAGFQNKGYQIGGFQAYVTSDVLIGAGLSSSAAFETLIGTILSGLYNDMKVSPVEIAMIGQYAENVYFGKPCGLMDQMACSVGSFVHIDFRDPKYPEINKLDFNMSDHGYSLCITDTKGSHADLTEEYAAIPQEMKSVANFFGKKFLREVELEDVLKSINELRLNLGDRSLLRALHYFYENERVKKQVCALKQGNIEAFLQEVKTSGNSSFKYLQNVYSNMNVMNQNISVALMISDITLKTEGVSRVHGGGFAGTIQCYIPSDLYSDYKNMIEKVFGANSCVKLFVRPVGGYEIKL